MANKNPSPETRFKKNDPRINRRGRPENFDEFRALAKLIANEKAIEKGVIKTIDGHAVSVGENILRQWAQSKDPRLVQAFIAYAYGKPPERTELTGKDGGKIEQDVTHHGDADLLRKLLPELTPSGAPGAAKATDGE